jgi:hypothetical protein
MFRKTAFALATIASLAVLALAPTEAAAKSWKNHHGYHGWGRVAIGSAIILGTAAAVNASCWRYAENRYGELVRVWVCD